MKRKTRAAANANAETTVENETVENSEAEADQDEQVSNEIAAETTSDVAEDVDVSNEEGADDENQTDGNPDDVKCTFTALSQPVCLSSDTVQSHVSLLS